MPPSWGRFARWDIFCRGLRKGSTCASARSTSSTYAASSKGSPATGSHHARLWARMMAHQPRTPSAWIILLARFTPHKNTPSAWMMAPDLVPVPSPVLRVGHFSRALLVYSCQAPKHRRLAVVNHRWREQFDAGVAVLLVVPSEKVLAKGSGILDTAKPFREVRPVLQRAKVAFRIRVVVGNIGAAVRFGDAQVGQQEGHRLGRHRGAAVSVDGQLVRLDVLLVAGIGNQPFGQLRGFARRHHPADHVPAENIPDDIEIEVGPLGLALQLGDVPTPELIRRRGQKLWLLICRMGEVIATFTSFTLLFQNPVHCAERAVIDALVQQ